MRGPFTFRQQYRAADNNRVPEMVELVALVRSAIPVVRLHDHRNRDFVLSVETLTAMWEKHHRSPRNKGLPLNLEIVGVAADGHEPWCFLLTVGSPVGGLFNDSFDLWFSDRIVLPHCSLIERLIVVGSPFESHLRERKNFSMFLEKVEHARVTGWLKPAYICPLHFLGKELVQSLGGLEKCLAVPAYEARPFRDGVLIKLVEERFDPENPSHLRIQQAANEFLGL